MSFTLQLNGSPRDFANLTPPITLAQLIAELQLKGDRIAVELNGAIVERTHWPGTLLGAGDRLEVVHFVGGGTSTSDRPDRIDEGKDAGLGRAAIAGFLVRGLTDGAAIELKTVARPQAGTEQKK